jgi:hypothetical protein
MSSGAEVVTATLGFSSSGDCASDSFSCNRQIGMSDNSSTTFQASLYLPFTVYNILKGSKITSSSLNILMMVIYHYFPCSRLHSSSVFLKSLKNHFVSKDGSSFICR